MRQFISLRVRVFILSILVLSQVPGLGSKAHAQNNPLPFINMPLSPASVAPGGSQFTLTVTGTGFVSNSIVGWNGSQRATTFVNSSTLTATILASDIAQRGTARVTVFNPPPGGGFSNALLLEISPSAPAIAMTGSNLSVAAGPSAVAVDDFNGDGKLDLAVTNTDCASPPCSPGLVSILLGIGDGTFASPVTYGIGVQPQAVITADFNGDLKPDLAVANSGDNTVSILLGNGDGTFQPAAAYSTGLEPLALVTADFNGDGKLDLAVANQYSGTVSILLGNGDGTFQTNVDYSAGLLPSSLAVGDFNGDGKLDLVVANFDGGNVSVLLGNGDGTFQPPVNYGTFFNPHSVAVADLNGDGKLDLVVADLTANAVFVLLGNGDGTFGSQQSFATGASPTSVVLGDLNADGKLDLALADDDNLGSVSTLLGNGDGTFQSYVDFSTGLLPVAVAVGDFNRDGRLDLVTTNVNDSTVSVLLSTPIQLSTNSLSFGNQNIGTTSTTQTVTLSNLNARAINITSITASGNYAQTNNCGTSIAPATSCAVSVTFTPLNPGPMAGTVTTVYGAPGGPQIVSLTGTGTGPFVSLSTTSLTFGPQLVGTPSTAQVVTLTNTGNAILRISSIVSSGDFHDGTSCGASLAAGDLCKIFVTFTPTATGTRTGTLTITDNAVGSPHTVSLTGTGVQPAVTLSAQSLTFATQPIGTTSAAQNITLTNTGTATLNITGITKGGANSGDFAETNTCNSLAANASCTITTTFTPTAAGARNATILIKDNAPGTPQLISLTGTGTSVELSAQSLNFGIVLLPGSSPPQTVTLTNVGSKTLSFKSIKLTGADPGDYSQSNSCGASIGGGASCTFTVVFAPKAVATRTASLSISDTDVTSPQMVSLTGNGTEVELSAQSLSFGSQAVWTSSQPQTITLTNVGSTTLDFGGFVISGPTASDFSQTNTCGKNIAGGANCSISVVFIPQAKGARKAILNISDNGGASPQAITLTGTGT